MGLTQKSKRLLEIIALSGLDALQFAANPKSLIYGAVGWDSTRNARRHLRSLREKDFVEISHERRSGSWVAKLTENGKAQLLEGIDPELSWQYQWDGKWTSLSFDLPQGARKERKRLGVWLKKRRFGNLQGSLWISHLPYSTWTDEIESREIDPKAVLFQQIMPVGRITSKEYATKAWPFVEINRRYSEYLRFLEKNAPGEYSSISGWFESESNLWNAAFELDPFLPEPLLPKGYLGIRAWNRKKQVFARLAKKVHQPQDLL